MREMYSLLISLTFMTILKPVKQSLLEIMGQGDHMTGFWPLVILEMDPDFQENLVRGLPLVLKETELSDLERFNIKSGLGHRACSSVLWY